MADKIDLTTLYKSQISLTEWFEKTNYKDIDKFRGEDNKKRDRLEILHQEINLPYDKPHQFPAIDLANQPPKFKEFLQVHGHELCALRLNPLDPTLPKLRMRGHTINNAMNWFRDQKVDPEKYQADFVPHSDNSLWATIFVVTKNGFLGEITSGGHHQLTQGFYDQGKPIVFTYDFKKWSLSNSNPQALAHLKIIAASLKVSNLKTQKKLTAALNAEFANYYLCGYFETTFSTDFGLFFIDYNRLLGKFYSEKLPVLHQKKKSSTTISGQVGSQGKVTGTAKIVSFNDLKTAEIMTEDILVCDMTTPDFLPLMAKAGGIITDLGGILSHAAIISRELKKPCLVGTENATKLIKTGDKIELDAINGVAKIL